MQRTSSFLKPGRGHAPGIKSYQGKEWRRKEEPGSLVLQRHRNPGSWSLEGEPGAGSRVLSVMVASKTGPQTCTLSSSLNPSGNPSILPVNSLFRSNWLMSMSFACRNKKQTLRCPVFLGAFVVCCVGLNMQQKP